MAQEGLHSPSCLPPAVSAGSRGGRGHEEAEGDDDGDRREDRIGCHWMVSGVVGVVQWTCGGGQGGRGGGKGEWP